MWHCLFPSQWGLHDFSNIIERGLLSTSASSVRTLGCISLDLWMFRFIKLQAWWLLTLWCTLFSPPSNSSAWGVCEDQLLVKTVAKQLLSTSDFSLSIDSSLHASLTRGDVSLLELLVDVPVEAIFVLCTPCQVLFQLGLGLSDPISAQPSKFPKYSRSLTSSVETFVGEPKSVFFFFGLINYTSES